MATRPRSIFEEVGTAQKPAVAPGGIDRGRTDGRGAIRLWLMALFGLVVLMIAVGGITRLTDSGLSITRWNVVVGAVPPLSDADWQAEFALYQASPQYQLINSGMELAEFKNIYWWEWGHRQLGRFIGLVWALGFAIFALTRRIPAGWTRRLLLVGALGGAQAAVGWWMVHSGLAEGMISVASYRLAIHLGLAFAILGLLGWYVFRLERREADLLAARRHGTKALVAGATGLMHLTFVQVLLGALVAGIDAGRAFPTWPLMGDAFLPPDPFSRDPLWRNFFEDPGLVQFIHRMSAYLLAVLALLVWLRARRAAERATVRAFHLMAGMLAVQIVIGILTALYSAPLLLALVHQFGAVLLFTLILRARFLARYPLPQSARG